MSTRPEWQALFRLAAQNQVVADREKLARQYRDPANDGSEPEYATDQFRLERADEEPAGPGPPARVSSKSLAEALKAVTRA